MIWGDIFNAMFAGLLDIDQGVVLSTYKEPDKQQTLELGVGLYLKEIAAEQITRRYLLLAIQWRKPIPNFGFCYWIPKEIIETSNEKPLLEILMAFAEMFGIRIVIGNNNGKFIAKATVLVSDSNTDLSSIVNVTGSDEVSCHLYSFYNERTPAEIDLYYCFAVNTNKYLNWLHGGDWVSVRVPLEWVHFLEPITDLLWLDRHVRLKTLVPHKDEISAIDQFVYLKESETQSISSIRIDLQLPKKYRLPIQNLVSQLERLSPNQKIVVVPIIDKEKCVFCSSDKVSKEHIFPVWLLRQFEQLTFQPSVLIATEAEGFNALEAMKSRLSVNRRTEAITTKSICKTCNETWMSQLEERTKNILIGTDGRLKDSLSLLNTSTEGLAMWLLKIALLLPYGLMQHPANFPQHFYQDLKNGLLPKGLLVELGRTSSYKLDFELTDRPSAYKLQTLSVNDAKQMNGEYICFCVQIGHLLFRLSYFPPKHVLHRLILSGVGQMKVIYADEAELKYYDNPAGYELWNASLEMGFELYSLRWGILISDRTDYDKEP